MHVYFGEGLATPVEVTTVSYPEPRPTVSDWFPPPNPSWGKRGGTYWFVWDQNGDTEVPDVRGKGRQHAETLMQDLDVVIQLRNTADVPPNEVISQDIPERTLLAPGATITLEVAR